MRLHSFWKIFYIRALLWKSNYMFFYIDVSFLLNLNNIKLRLKRIIWHFYWFIFLLSLSAQFIGSETCVAFIFSLLTWRSVIFCETFKWLCFCLNNWCFVVQLREFSAIKIIVQRLSNTTQSVRDCLGVNPLSFSRRTEWSKKKRMSWVLSARMHFSTYRASHRSDRQSELTLVCLSRRFQVQTACFRIILFFCFEELCNFDMFENDTVVHSIDGFVFVSIPMSHYWLTKHKALLTSKKKKKFVQMLLCYDPRSLYSAVLLLPDFCSTICGNPCLIMSEKCLFLWVISLETNPSHHKQFPI